ncbi:16S rRNA (guanine(966)-N(2))-methyltransferase RsmD [Bacillaceae bacterium S4-13-58]
MRIIAGVHKGRHIEPVPHQSTRPTTDKVREAIFDMIGPFFNGGLALDLFAGSGGLGIEGLSRGFSKVIFVDHHPKAIKTLNHNIKELKLEDKTEIFRADAIRALKGASKRDLAFDYVFLDPPYLKFSIQDILMQLEELTLIKDQAIIVCEHDQKESLPDILKGFHKIKEETYGSVIKVTIYKWNRKGE